MNQMPTPSRWANYSWASGEPEAQEPEQELAPLSLDHGVLRAATESGDAETAVAIGGRFVDANFAQVHGAEVAELEAEAAYVRPRLAAEGATLDRLDKTLAGQPHRIPATQANGGVDGPGDASSEIPFGRWQTRDQLLAILVVVGICGLSIASYFGFHATFAAAQLPVFDDFPHLPFMLAAIAPAAGLAVKLVGGLFDDPATRALYRKSVGIAGVVAFILYVPLLAALYEGLSGVFDPFAEPNHFLGWAFNVAHVFAETLIAAGLYTHLEAVMMKYAPSEEIDNPARPPLERSKAWQAGPVEQLRLRLGRIEGRLARLYGLRESTRILVETAIRQRMNEKPREGLL